MSKQCQSCGMPIRPEEEFCTDCFSSEMDDYRIVKNYLRANPNSNAMQIANATGVSVSKIIKYIRTGSFTVVDSPGQRRSR
ncbi:zinc ribbon domain-containing protein [Brevibacillus migulae]|uniref:hypothetical protein n=1 Tax=Brevibacillus migulae TaxID=1644114 RepID=UPI00106EF7E6|nr:hypothetical protein [Brevibacillus migulae]